MAMVHFLEHSMAKRNKSLTQQYGVVSRDLTQEYVDEPSRFANVDEVYAMIIDVLPSMPRQFRKKELSEKLKVSTDKDARLVTNGLYRAQKAALIEFDQDNKWWRNNA